MSFQDICIKLREQGIKCKWADWSSSTISYMLKNPAYYGNYIVNQYVYEDGSRGVGSKRTKRKKPSSEHITYQITPLISKSRWDQIQQRIEFNKLKSKRSNRTKDFFVRDVLICGRCGGRVKPKLGTVRKDGTAPRYYACYWASTSKKNLKASGRHRKCSLPYLKAKSVENAVWADISVWLALNPDKAFGHLFDSNKHMVKMDRLQETVKRLDAELKKKKRARNNLFMFMEDETMNQDELRERLRVNEYERLELEGNLDNTCLQYQELQSLKEREQEISDFLYQNKHILKQLRRDIMKLDLADRKLLVESMLKEKITVDYQDDNEYDGPGGTSSDYRLRWNPDILQRFMNEGKISKLDKNSTDDLAGYEL